VVILKDYVKLLRKHKLKITPQRLEIINFLDKNRTHPTANEIYSALKKNNPSLSKTTVYNSLDKLIQHNLVNELTISKSESRYDFKNEMHHHFLCKNCGQIIDIEVECPFLDKMLNSKHKVEEVHGYFKGICENCRKKKNN